MTRRLLLALAIPLAPALAQDDGPPPDLLRFSNGDQLHGSFAGIDERGRILWQRGDMEQTVEFEPGKLRQIVLRGGRPARGIHSVSHARMVGGDRIPGSIVSLDAGHVILDTPFAGRLSLPRNRVDVLAPQPFGGKVHYAGPFDEDGWRLLDAKPEGNSGETPEEESDEPPRKSWAFARSAWYSGKEANWPLVRDTGMGAAALLRFRLSWRSQLAFSLAFHADFAPPPEEEKEKWVGMQARRGTLGLPYRFGNCYVLNLHSHYAKMYRCGFDENGKSFTRTMQNSSNSFRLPQVGDSAVELRCDRKTGRILLFIDGEFAMQWDESDIDYAGKGAGFGFQVGGASARVRISDILLAEWNGMVDSARSMDAPDRDVVLLTNGTDRFSGQVAAITDDHLELSSSYAKMKIPLSRVAEIHFARETLAEAPEAKADEIIVHSYPIGRISGTPGQSGNDLLLLDSTHFGQIKLQLDYAAILDLQPGNSFIDDWDTGF